MLLLYNTDMRTKQFRNNLKTAFPPSLPLLIYVAIYMLWWMLLEHKAPGTGYSVIHTPVDDLIPFNEYFVIPYLLWFLYITFVVVYFLFKCDRLEYFQLLAFLGAGMTVFLITSTLFPNSLQLRPAFFAHDNVFTDLVRFVYRNDTPTNVFPSIHVYNSLACYLAVMHSKQLSRRAHIASFVLSLSIVMSTMFIKQHSVFDVMCAFALCIIFDYLVYRTSFVKNLVRSRRQHRVHTH